jgi:hypothetical protein
MTSPARLNIAESREQPTLIENFGRTRGETKTP